MPCREEKYILLEQSVTVDSKEVDALVTKIGEALQLHNNSAQKTITSCLKQTTTTTTTNNGQIQQQPGLLQTQTQRTSCCMRLRTHRGHHGHQHRSNSRASPYYVPESRDQQADSSSSSSSSWDQQHFRPWSRRRGPGSGVGDEDDPHRLLQELILSGNLIKEAVRRLKFPGGGVECTEDYTGGDSSCPQMTEGLQCS